MKASTSVRPVAVGGETTQPRPAARFSTHTASVATTAKVRWWEQQVVPEEGVRLAFSWSYNTRTGTVNLSVFGRLNMVSNAYTSRRLM